MGHYKWIERKKCDIKMSDLQLKCVYAFIRRFRQGFVSCFLGGARLNNVRKMQISNAVLSHSTSLLRVKQSNRYWSVWNFFSLIFGMAECCLPVINLNFSTCNFLGQFEFFSRYYSDRIYSIAPNRIFNKGNWFEIWIAWSELFMFEREKTWICSVHERFANIISTHNPSPSLSAPYLPFLCFLYTGFPFAWHRFTIALMLHTCIVWNNLQTQCNKPQPNYHKKSSQSHCRSLKQSDIKKSGN